MSATCHAYTNASVECIMCICLSMTKVYMCFFVLAYMCSYVCEFDVCLCLLMPQMLMCLRGFAHMCRHEQELVMCMCCVMCLLMPQLLMCICVLVYMCRYVKELEVSLCLLMPQFAHVFMLVCVYVQVRTRACQDA